MRRTALDQVFERSLEAWCRVDPRSSGIGTREKGGSKPSESYTPTAESGGISRRAAVASAAAVAGGGMTLFGVSAQADDDGLVVTETLEDGNITAVDLADTLLPTGTEDGVELIEESVAYTGAEPAAGVFQGEIQATEAADPEPGDRETFGFEDGIILSTGRVDEVEGPNEESDTTTDFGEPGDEDLEALEGVGNTNNAAVLEFEFDVPPGTDTVGFNYLFGSVEYNDFVFSINDVFAFFVNGTDPDDNAATVPSDDPDGQPTRIDTVNHGTPFEDPVNPELYVNNDPFTGEQIADEIDPTDPPGPGIGFDPSTGDEPYDTEMNGFSVELEIVADVDPAENPQEIKIAVADESDGILNTWVLLEAESFEVDPDTGPAVRVEGDNVTITDTTVTNETVGNDAE